MTRSPMTTTGELGELIAALPRIHFAQRPTPVENLATLARVLGGPQLLIKRDDQTGLAFGGNKTRKLEFLIAEALREGCTGIVTAGAAQSNHCRQAAAAAARAGLECDLVLGGTPTDHPAGNLLLDHLLGARVHWTDRDRRVERMTEIASELAKKGKRVRVIPYGGSTGLGAVGYVEAMAEMMDQIPPRGPRVDRIVVASSSGGTQAGLALGATLCGFEGQILGISIDKGERDPVPYEEELAQIANAAAAVLGVSTRLSPSDFTVAYGYLGEGYGVVGDPEREAIVLTARHEGILLDPVYTGRAMAALIDLIRRGEIVRDETVLFWHTGGAPALFAYEADLGVAGTDVR